MAKLAALGSHSKWEVRRALANVASQNVNLDFNATLVRLAIDDDNDRVRKAAQQALDRRRDATRASVFARDHADRISATFDEIDARFSSKARVAVRRASEQIANMFASELSHELVRLISPITMSLDRLRAGLQGDSIDRKALDVEAAGLEARIERFTDILDSARRFTADPKLSFKSERLRAIVEESVQWVEEKRRKSPARRPAVQIKDSEDVYAEVCRSRLVQALVNILENAVDAYGVGDVDTPIVIELTKVEARAIVTVTDGGAGIPKARLADVRRLFFTTKPRGTGFGLPLAIKIVESEHCGTLGIESEEGRGTTIRLAFPLRASPSVLS